MALKMVIIIVANEVLSLGEDMDMEVGEEDMEVGVDMEGIGAKKDNSS